MDKSIVQVQADICTGCGACFNKCPVNAIEMKENRKGFIAPVVDADRCTNCGLCAKTCPALNTAAVRRMKANAPDCYAMMADKNTRKISSSGGMFTMLADYVLSQGGVVCGASYTDDYMGVEHIVVDSAEGLSRLRGSKYVQSNTKKTYREIEAHLENGGWALYTGSPCQIAGLRMYLKKDYEKLILADIICHGGPSPKVYRKYVREKAHGCKLIKSDFRDKSFWGWGSATSLFFEDGTEYRGNCFEDPYWRAFLNGLSVRQCCGKCEYANEHRVGDFTLGDFWGVADIDKKCDDGMGTSLVLVNTEKAKAVLGKIEKKIHFLKKMDFNAAKEVAKTRNGRLLFAKEQHWAHERFFWLLDMKPFSVAYDFAINSKYDVGVTGWWYNDNYGGTMTYFALNKVLRSMGQTVLMIAKCSDDPNYQPNYKSIPYRFAVKHYNISKNYTHENIGTLADHCTSFVSGSDQLFNPTLWRWSGPQYFLNYAKNKNKIISYASSFGNEFYDVWNLKVPMSYWLRRFDALSVRESYGVDICRDVFGLEAKKVMDPVFLCDVKEYEMLAEQSGKKKTHDFMISFFLDPNDGKRQTILDLSEKLGMPSINLLDAIHYEDKAKKLNLPNTKPGIDIEEWVFYYKNADFVITDSFHGTCFAIIFRKKFISVANRQRGANRFVSILEEAGLIDRLVWDLDEIKTRPELFEDIDYDKVYERLEPKIQESYEWLKNAVTTPKKMAATEFNALDYEIGRLRDEVEKLRSEVKNGGNAAAPAPAKRSFAARVKGKLLREGKRVYRKLRQVARGVIQKDK